MESLNIGNTRNEMIKFFYAGALYRISISNFDQVSVLFLKHQKYVAYFMMNFYVIKIELNCSKNRHENSL